MSLGRYNAPKLNKQFIMLHKYTHAHFTEFASQYASFQ